MEVVLLISLLAAAFAFLYRFSKEFTDLVSIALYGVLGLSAQHRATLAHWSRYYGRLDPQGRKRFERRVKELLYEKEWVGRRIAVTWEMKVRIAAALAQLTFGYRNLLLLHFRRIVVHPDAYSNPRTGRRHIGEAAPGQKTLVFSWKHFVEGFSTPDDALNVGLHEAAHALWFENVIPSGEFGFLPAGPLARWRQLAREEMARIKAGRSRLFRAYAATNEAEFFAVAVEYFFEQPEEFREHMPEVQACLAQLLRQVPATSAAPRAAAG